MQPIMYKTLVYRSGVSQKANKKALHGKQTIDIKGIANQGSLWKQSTRWI